MKHTRRMALSIFWLVLGLGLIGCSLLGLVDDFWSGMGTGLATLGGIQTVRHLRYRSDADYREKVDVAYTDERNRYIRLKAWAWAGYLFVLLTAIASVGLRVAGQELLATAAGMGLCLIIVLYWGSYWYLAKKY